VTRLPDVPAALEARRSADGAWAAWLDALPGRTRDLLAEWELALDPPDEGGPWHGVAAWVLPVRTADGEAAALKVGFPHPEAAHEHLALRAWDGRGAARLLRADPRRSALLLERLGTTDLHAVDPVAAAEIVGALYADLHVPAPPSLPRLSGFVDRWTADLATAPRDAAVPRRLVEQAVSLGRSMAVDAATDGVLVHGDLHFANVLALPASADPAVRGGSWLAIDPKPMSGDPAYEVAPLLWNRWAEIEAGGDVRAAVRRRFHAAIDAALLDEDRARGWVVVRVVLNAWWTLEAARAAGRPLTADDRLDLTRYVTIAKAVQD